MEAIILLSFVAVQASAKLLPVAFGKIAHLVWVQKLSKNHWIVWFFHPVVLHGLHDYAVHFVVYSGYIIRSH